MKITFLGTSHGFGDKGRFTSSTLVESGEHGYLVDAGAPVETLMANMDKDYAEFRGVFLTHMHSDHVCCLPAVLEPFMGFRYNNNVTCFFPEQAGMDGFFAWETVMGSYVELLKTIAVYKITTEGMIYEDADIRVSAVPTNHTVYIGDTPTSWGYIFEHDGKRVLFTGDMGCGFHEYPTMTGNLHFDLVICEMAHGDLCEVADMLRATDTARMIINHYHYPKLEGMDTIFPTFPFPVELAHDGMIVDI